jgi:hypothetical protein
VVLVDVFRCYGDAARLNSVGVDVAAFVDYAYD